MKILQAEKYYWPQGGASKYALDLSSSLEDAGHVVVPFATAHERNLPSRYSDYFVPALDFSELSETSLWRRIISAKNMLYSAEAKQKLEMLLQKEQIDIAHIHNIYHQISPSILPVLRKRGIPVAMTLHDYKLLTPNYTFFHHGAVHDEDAVGWYLSCVKNKCFKNNRLYSALVTLEMIFHHKIKKYYKNNINVFLAPSQFMKNTCIRFGWDEKVIEHLPLPVAVSDHKPSKPGDYVAYIGRLVEEKGLAVLCEAAMLTPDIPYKIVGDGPMLPKLKLFLKEKKITNVDLVGYKNGHELDRLFTQSRLLVVPSIWYENYPLSVLEAKARGKVVIASNIGGLPEMLPEELLVPPHDAHMLAQKITAWYGDSDRALLKMGTTLQDEVREVNDPVKHRERLLRLYERFIGQ